MLKSNQDMGPTTAGTAAPTHLTWGLAIATYNRAEELLKTVEYALRQTRPPVEVVACDSSADWEGTSRRVSALVDRIAPGTRVCYLKAPAAQQTIQRNVAIEHASADILFMIDDDAYLWRDAAAQVMSVYEADREGIMAAVGLGAMRTWDGFDAAQPGPIVLKPDIARRTLGAIQGFWAWARPRRSKPFVPPKVGLPLQATNFLGGFQITVRRDVAAGCRFDECLASGHFEDSDGTYRFSQQGGVAMIEKPLLFHATAPRATGEARRGTLARFGWVINFSYLNRKYFGDSLYVRLHCLSLWARYLPFDLAIGLARRDLSRFWGGLFAFRPLLRLITCPQPDIGRIVVEETAAMKKWISQRRT